MPAGIGAHASRTANPARLWFALSPLPGRGFSRVTGPACGRASCGPPGIIPDPYAPNLADRPALFQGKSHGFPQDDTAGNSRQIGCNPRQFQGLGNKGSMRWAWPSADFQQGMAARLQQAGQQVRQGPIGIQPVRAAIQGGAGLECATLRAPVIRCRRTGYRADWRRSGRTALGAVFQSACRISARAADQPRGIARWPRRSASGEDSKPMPVALGNSFSAAIRMAPEPVPRSAMRSGAAAVRNRLAAPPRSGFRCRGAAPARRDRPRNPGSRIPCGR